STHCHNSYYYTYAANAMIYSLSLHDALPIYFTIFDSADGLDFRHNIPFVLFRLLFKLWQRGNHLVPQVRLSCWSRRLFVLLAGRSEEHTSELQSRGHLVCRLLLEKKKLNLFL